MTTEAFAAQIAAAIAAGIAKDPTLAAMADAAPEHEGLTEEDLDLFFALDSIDEPAREAA